MRGSESGEVVERRRGRQSNAYLPRLFFSTTSPFLSYLDFSFLPRFLFATSVFLCYLAPALADERETAMEMMKRSVNPPITDQDWWFQFGPRSGAFMPVNLTFRETYGGSNFFYGMGLTGFYQDLGWRLEVEHLDADRLLPLNETNQWRSVQSDLSLTSFWVSMLKRVSGDPWTAHVGVGGGVVMASERFRGDAYVNNAWSYVDFFQTETMFGLQFIAGFMRQNRFGMEIKYSYVPRRGVSGFADFGGFSALLTLSF